jgi:TolB protein
MCYALGMMRIALIAGIWISLLNVPLLASARALGGSLPAQQLFYSQAAQGFPNLYVMDVERGLSQLFVRNTDPYSLAWSPDGEQLAFASDPNGRGLEIYVAGAYSGAAQRITTEETSNYAPRWINDNKAIMFARFDRISSQRWAMIDLASGLIQPHPIDQIIDPQTERAWSPDGRQVAFILRRQETLLNEILVGNAECLSALVVCAEPLRRLRPGPSVRYGIAGLRWSPDGRSIAFSAFTSGTDNRDIYLIDTQRTGAQRISSHRAADVGPVWSPDGRKLAFLSNRDGLLQLYMLNLDCLPHDCESSVRQLTRDSGSLSMESVWSPDGRLIAFVSDRDGNHEIYVVNVEDGSVRRLTVDPRKNDAPSWRP